MKKRFSEHTRLWLLLGVSILSLAGIGWRIFDIAYLRHAWYAQVAQAQADGAGGVLLRGNIYLTDTTGQKYLVATNRKFPVLSLVPTKMNTAGMDRVIDELVVATGGDRAAIARVAQSGASGARVAVRRLTDAQAQAVTALAEPGVGIAYETDRYYPAGMLAADVIGFLGYDQDGRHGQYGIEAQYETQLAGTSPATPLSSSRLWDRVAAMVGQTAQADPSQRRPSDIELTIDKNIQAYAQDALDAVLKQYHAASGVIIVQEPATGRLLAMADSPSFDPNSYGSAPTRAFMNTAVQQAFEPGSSFKPFTMAMGLEKGVIGPNTTYDDDKDIVVDGYTIKNYNEGHFGRVTMTKVLEKSINAGTMYVQSLVGQDAFLNAAINLGLGQKTGVDAPGEASGDINNLYSGRRINFLTASFGQGITVTPLQLINGYAAIANGGKLMRPYMVAGVRDDAGRLVATQPEVIGTPFSAKTAATLRTMLTSVVDNGFDKARIPRYDVAGKTGTAQIADQEKGGYLEGQYIHTFVGFAPSSNPKFVILIKMEKPKGITFASDSLSPTFKNVALFLLNYLNVPPTR